MMQLLLAILCATPNIRSSFSAKVFLYSIFFYILRKNNLFFYHSNCFISQKYHYPLLQNLPFIKQPKDLWLLERSLQSIWPLESKSEAKQIGFWDFIRRLGSWAIHNRSLVSGDREMARERWNTTSGIHGLESILGFWAGVMMFALVLFAVIIFSCAEGAESKDKNDGGGDTTAYGGSECVAGCGAGCGG
ncbi:unnamed protein product [Lactuca virosa]|uniref:Uncharacterized protein n=1 Tax=Lactuca virosa TaxID=75947 RepID=A0AAU9M9M7_9ASTR|nr:unnamed protein product [Lactuca virosa]